MDTKHLTPHDAAVVESFQNFLSWGAQPGPQSYVRDWPPAVFAYALGSTQFCPPVGTL